MKHYIKQKGIIILLRLAQAILFAIPFVVFILIHKSTFLTQKSGIGLTGLGTLGLLIYILCLKKVFGTMKPTCKLILFFVALFIVFQCMDMLSGFLAQLGGTLIISAVLSVPINFIIEMMQVDADTSLKEESKHKARKRMKQQEIEVEIN